MGNLVTVPKRFSRLIYKRERVLDEKKTRKIYFQGQKVRVLIQGNYQQIRDSQHLKFMYCFFV